jgi:hypothetical protein
MLYILLQSQRRGHLADTVMFCLSRPFCDGRPKAKRVSRAGPLTSVQRVGHCQQEAKQGLMQGLVTVEFYLSRDVDCGEGIVTTSGHPGFRG